MRRSLQSLVVILSFMILSPAYSQEGYFRDDFTGPSLKPELRINVEDKDRWTFVEGDYLMVVPKKREGGVTNYINFEGNLVENYNFSVKATSLPTHAGFATDISLGKDNDNWILLQLSISDLYPYVFVRYFKSLRGEVSSYEYKGGILEGINDISLSIQKKGIEYIGYFSVDGGNWITLGTHAFLNFDGKPGFGAYNRQQAPEAPVRFDYVEIRPID